MNRLVSSAIIRAAPRNFHRVVRHHGFPRNAFSTIPNTAAEEPYTLPPSLATVRANILQTALEEVHQHGWSEEALASATASVLAKHSPKAKISMSVVGTITVDDLIAFCMDHFNLRLKEDLLMPPKEPNDNNTATPNMDPLEKGIKTRLEYLIPYLQSNRWHEGMALGIRGPANALQTQRQLQELVETIVAFSPKHRSALGTPERMALGAVYVATELHLLTDASPGYQDTWAFLGSRMEDWRGLASMGSTQGAGDALLVATSVGSSLMGGLVSLVVGNPSTKAGMFGLSQAVLASLFSNGWEQRPAGSHPDDYNKVPRKQPPAKSPYSYQN